MDWVRTQSNLPSSEGHLEGGNVFSCLSGICSYVIIMYWSQDCSAMLAMDDWDCWVNRFVAVGYMYM